MDSRLIFAIWHNNTAEVIRILKLGADVNQKDQKQGHTLLHTATQWGSTEIVRILLEFGADPNVQDKDGWTPLMYGATTGEIDAMTLLIDHKADMGIINNQGETALNILKRSHHDTYMLVIQIIMKKNMLEHEDSDGTADQCPGPDFDI